jgi:4-hydroxymandelate oxidase
MENYRGSVLLVGTAAFAGFLLWYRKSTKAVDRLPLLSLAEIERVGKSRLPAHVVSYYSYTCGDGVTFRSAADAFDSIKIMTRVLCGISGDNVDTTLCVFGEKWNSPIMIAPTAFHKLPADEGELATARAAATAGACYVYPFMLSNTVADSVASAGGPKWAHLYILKVRICVCGFRCGSDRVLRMRPSSFFGTAELN